MSDDQELPPQFDLPASSIEEAISRVMEEIAYIRKRASTGVKYTFVGEADLIEAVRPILIRHSIVFWCSSSRVAHSERYTTSGGANMGLVRLETQWTFCHFPSKTTIVAEAAGEASDSGDKACSKAHTIALKYAVRQTLMLQTGDDPDKEVNERATKADQERQDRRQKYKDTAIKRIMEAKSADEVRKFMENPALTKYRSIVSEIRVLAERRIAELS